MVRVNLYVLDKNNKYLDLLATVLSTTRSQIINDVLTHIDSEDLEGDIWEGWTDLYKEYLEFVESIGEDEEDEDEEELIEGPHAIGEREEEDLDPQFTIVEK